MCLPHGNSKQLPQRFRGPLSAERLHDTVRVLLAHLGDEQRAHARAGATAQGVAHLEALQAVAALRLLTHDIEHGVDELRALRVVALAKAERK